MPMQLSSHPSEDGQAVPNQVECLGIHDHAVMRNLHFPWCCCSACSGLLHCMDAFQQLGLAKSGSVGLAVDLNSLFNGHEANDGRSVLGSSARYFSWDESRLIRWRRS